jgi:DNA repair protein RadC
MHELQHEELGLLFFNVKGNIMGHTISFVGGRNSVKIDIVNLLKDCILSQCFKVVVFHNHPNGEEKPSAIDLELCKIVKEALNKIKISYMGSYIVTGEQQITRIKESKRNENGRTRRIERPSIRRGNRYKRKNKRSKIYSF